MKLSSRAAQNCLAGSMPPTGRRLESPALDYSRVLAQKQQLAKWNGSFKGKSLNLKEQLLAKGNGNLKGKDPTFWTIEGQWYRNKGLLNGIVSFREIVQP